ncbi:MAG TPA: aromatic ring-hydroxylating dioxygenase subunit alpha [Steroidobacteraceae bacterium]|nr:aromatic ring-hydroxylating dioxygenase subunit alpha [Steroidobacteraceae bacterium]
MDAATVQRFLDGMKYEAERTAPPEAFPRLPDIPAGRYVDPAFLALERQYLWQRSWLYACHLDELPTPGSFLLLRKTGSPILVVRGEDDVVRAFYNTCRHRGGPVVRSEKGCVKGFVCGYHGWSYSLDGALLNLRDKRDFVGLDFAAHGLRPIRCERFFNWIFINEDPRAEPLLEHLAPFGEYFRQFQPEEWRLVAQEAREVRCNVKVLLDAFLEVYHLKSIHQNTVDRFLDHRGTTIALYRRGHSLMVTPNRRPEWVDPGTIGMRRIETATVIASRNNASFNFFPNLVVPVDPTGCPFLLFWPTSDTTMRIECHWFAPDWGGGAPSELWKVRIANFDRILDEDLQFAPSIQESVMSRGFTGIPLSYQERRIYHWHAELDRRIGEEHIPQALRVPPLLDAFVEN